MSVRRAAKQSRVCPKGTGVMTRSMRLLLDAANQNGNRVACGGEEASSSNSVRSSYSLSSSSGGGRSSRQSPADVEMLDSSGRGQEEGVSRLQSGDKPMSLYLDTKPDNWNKNLALAMTGLQDDQRADASPDSAMSEGSSEPGVPSRRGSCDDWVSSLAVGSGPSDSGSTRPPSTFLLGRSPAPPRPHVDAGLSSVLLPDICEGLLDITEETAISDEDIDSQRGGITFFLRPSCENTYLAFDESPPGLDAAEQDCTTPAALCRTYVMSEPPQCSSGACTPAGGRTFVVLGTEDSDTSCGARTSTPVQSSAANKTICLPHSSESLSRHNRGNGGSPAARLSKGRPPPPDKPSPVTSRLPPSHRRAKTEPTRFPQPDLKNVKSKVLSQPTTPLRVSNLARVTTTPGKPAPANRNSPAASTVQRKGEVADGARRLGMSLNSKGATQKSRLRRSSECDSTLSLRPCRDGYFSSAQREVPNRGTVMPPFELDRQRTPLQGNGTPGRMVRPSGPDLQANGTPAQRSAEDQEVASAAAADGGRGRLGLSPSPGRVRGASSSISSSRTPDPGPAAHQSSAPGKYGRVSGSALPKHAAATGTSKMRLTERPPSIASGAKPVTSPCTGTPRSAGVSRLPVKSQDHGEPSGRAQASVPDSGKAVRPATPGKPPVSKPGGVKVIVAQSHQRQTLSAGVGNAPVPNQMPPKSVATASPPHRPASGRFQRLLPVGRSRQQRAGPRTPVATPPDSQPIETKPPGAELHRPGDDGGASGKRLQQLRELLASGNRRFEALALVVQHIIAEREEAKKQKRELSQELLTLRGELVTSSALCEALEREKDELRPVFDGIVHKLQEQHRSDLAELEERLKAFYSAEWEKMHQAYQDEADRCQTQMQQQLDEFKSKQEALREELEGGHVEKLDVLRRRYEATLEELRMTHQEEMETLNKTQKEAESKFTEQVLELTAENGALNEKLNAEEERRILAEKCQKDSHTLYLEQELESLKVVLDIKNKQLHQQDKKLIQMDKVMEKNEKLDECLKKVQQENEDLKVRMYKHAARSRQLSTEQAALQESLEKESKVNKRLSMEIEALNWKLQNGDLSSPRKLSPTSPTKAFQSPHNSGLFPSTPVSPS